MMTAECTVPWLHWIVCNPDCQLGFTSRGSASGSGSPYSGFNLCHYTGDTLDHVGQSRALFAEAVGVDEDHLVIPRQVHSAVVKLIDSIPVDPEEIEGVDALVTKLKGVVIGVSTADCVPLVLVDAAAGVAGVVHAGWRGALAGVVDNALGLMVENGALQGRIKAYFGPAICLDCFEVGEEVAAQFPDAFVGRRVGWARPHVDLPAYVASCLRAAAVRPCNIRFFDRAICTRCHSDRYFSARAEGINSGRNFTFVVLR